MHILILLKGLKLTETNYGTDVYKDTPDAKWGILIYIFYPKINGFYPTDSTFLASGPLITSIHLPCYWRVWRYQRGNQNS
jgi:hypothetical protein